LIEISAGLRWWRSQPDASAWLSKLPVIIDACVEEWGLNLGAPFDLARASGRLVGYVARATLSDRTRAVLKVNFPR